MKTYLPWLDLLRFVACFLVIVNHCNPPGDGTLGAVSIHGAEHLGHAGVALFFSISGYLIGTILLNSFRKPGWLRLFYAHRFLRIYPPFLAAMAMFGGLLLTGVQHNPHAKTRFFTYLPYYLTFTFQLIPQPPDVTGGMPFGIVWSLCVEEFFYLLLPLVFLLGTRTRVLAVLLLITVINLEPRFHTLPDGSGTWFILPHNLIGGAIMALLKPKRTGFPWVGLVATGVFAFNCATGFFEQFGPIMATVTTLIVWSFATTRTPYPMQGAVFLWAGRLSYGVYLLHLPVCSLANRAYLYLGLPADSPALFWLFAPVVAMVISTLMAAVMYKTIEQPAQTVRKYVPGNPRLATALMLCQVSLVPLGIVYHLLKTGGVLP